MPSAKQSDEWDENDKVTWADHDGIQRAGYVVAVLSSQLLVRDDLAAGAIERFVFKNDPTLDKVR